MLLFLKVGEACNLSTEAAWIQSTYFSCLWLCQRWLFFRDHPESGSDKIVWDSSYECRGIVWQVMYASHAMYGGIENYRICTWFEGLIIDIKWFILTMLWVQEWYKLFPGVHDNITSKGKRTERKWGFSLLVSKILVRVRSITLLS